MLYEAEVLPGLKPIAIDEIRRLFPRHVPEIYDIDRDDQIHFRYVGRPFHLTKLRTVVAAYHVEHFDIPRPKALLGHEDFHRLLGRIRELMGIYHVGTYKTFRISAAGDDSPTFMRIKRELSQHLGLKLNEEDADLMLRVRKAELADEGWEVLIRTTPRPLSAREWRVEDMPGALNATIAAAMVELAAPDPYDAVLNLVSGSGTLLIERLERDKVAVALGVERDREALALAQANIEAAGYTENAILLQMDATQLGLPTLLFNVLLADLPWGQLVGTNAEIEALYPQLMREAARVAAPEARFVVITHAIELFEQVLEGHSHLWRVVDTIKVFQGGLHPRIYVLERTSS